MSPKTTTTKRSASLRQGTLGFASIKRTSSSASAGKLKKKPAKAQKSNIDESSEEEEGPDDVEPIESDEESERVVEEKVIPTPTSSKTKPTKVASEDRSKGLGLFKPKDNIELEKVEEKDPLPELNPKDPRWKKQYAHAKELMNGFQTIHGKDQNRVHEILRIFDLSYEYGPCVGVTRLERWERAHALGMNPPSEIKEILTTRQGVDEAQYSQCVFYDEV